MRVLLVAPHSLREPRGNSVTLARLAVGLRAAGLRVKLLGPDEPGPRGGFDIVHAFHATKAGPRALELAVRAGAALVVTLTGTDINQDLQDRRRGKVMRHVLEEAAALIAFSPAGRAQLQRQSKSWAAKTQVVPAGVAPQFFACGVGHKGRMQLRRRWRRRLRLKEDDFLFLWPGGIRAVKDPLLLLRAFPRLRARHPRARLIFVGPVLERSYGQRFRAVLRKVQGADYRPEVTPGQMPGLYAAADAVVNSSLSEGMSNALLEAMAAGIPVIARANAGNRALVAHGRTGLLYTSERDFLSEVTRLLRDAKLRRQLALAARRQARRRHSAVAEAAAHLRLNHSLMRERRDARP